MRAGDVVELEVEQIGLDGDGIGRVDGIEVGVAALFGGERARARIEHVSRVNPRAQARVLERLTSLPTRRPPPCLQHPDSGGKCSGCALMAIDEAEQGEQKRRMLAALGLEVEALVPAPAALGYRVSSKRVAFGRPGELRLGSYRRGTHAPADMRGCLVEHPRLAAAAEELAREASALGIEPYDERRQRGDLRYVWLKTDGERVLVTLVTASEESRAAAELPAALQVPAGVAHSVQAERGNALRGGPPRVLRGIESLSVSIGGVTTHAGPLGFLQPSPLAIEAAYRALVEAPRGELALDLYAGAGVTTALLRERFAEVVPCESYAESAAALGIEPEAVESLLARFERTPDLVIANPPRKGLGAPVCELLARLGAPRLHVMSCGPEGLARDLERLSRGGYRVERLLAYDTLPQTPHVELVARLVKTTV